MSRFWAAGGDSSEESDDDSDSSHESIGQARADTRWVAMSDDSGE
jgi:hypothetical protein